MLTVQAKQTLRNSCASTESAAPPHMKKRTRPPRILRTFLKMTRLSTGVSSPVRALGRLVRLRVPNLRVRVRGVRVLRVRVRVRVCLGNSLYRTLAQLIALVAVAPVEELAQELVLAGGDALAHELRDALHDGGHGVHDCRLEHTHVALGACTHEPEHQYSPVHTIPHSPFAIRHSLFTVHCSLFTVLVDPYSGRQMRSTCWPTRQLATRL